MTADVPPSPALRSGPSRKAIIAWTALMFLALALIWFVCAVIVPFVEARDYVEQCSQNGSLPPSAVEELGGGEEAARRLRTYLQMPAWLAPHRHIAAGMLFHCGEAGLPEAIRRLKDRDERVRARATLTAGLLLGPKAVPLIAPMLKDESAVVRREAADVLAGRGGKDTVGPFLEALSDSDELVLQNALNTLGQWGGPRVTESVGRMLRHGNLRVRQRAVVALGRLGNPRAIEFLADALRDSEPSVRFMAATGLGGIRDARVVAPLLSALGDKNADVRGCAAWSLGKVRSPRAVGPLIALLKDRKSGPREMAAKALAMFGASAKPAIPVLETLLKDKSDYVREVAAEALLKIPGGRHIVLKCPLFIGYGHPRGECITFHLKEDGQAKWRMFMNPTMVGPGGTLKVSPEKRREIMEAAGALLQAAAKLKPGAPEATQKIELQVVCRDEKKLVLTDYLEETQKLVAVLQTLTKVGLPKNERRPAAKKAPRAEKPENPTEPKNAAPARFPGKGDVW